MKSLLSDDAKIVLTSCSTGKQSYYFSPNKGFVFQESMAHAVSMATGKEVIAPKHDIYLNELEWDPLSSEIYFQHPMGKYTHAVDVDVSKEGIGRSVLQYSRFPDLLKKILNHPNASLIEIGDFQEAFRRCISTLSTESIRVLGSYLICYFEDLDSVISDLKKAASIEIQEPFVKRRYEVLSNLPCTKWVADLLSLSDAELISEFKLWNSKFISSDLDAKGVGDVLTFLMLKDPNPSDRSIQSGIFLCFANYDTKISLRLANELCQKFLKDKNINALSGFLIYAANLCKSKKNAPLISANNACRILRLAHEANRQILFDELFDYLIETKDKSLITNVLLKLAKTGNKESLKLFF